MCSASSAKSAVRCDVALIFTAVFRERETLGDEGEGGCETLPMEFGITTLVGGTGPLGHEDAVMVLNSYPSLSLHVILTMSTWKI